jgi:hypothetical protein
MMESPIKPIKETINKAIGDKTETEKVIEKFRFWQILVGAILGFTIPFIPMLVTYLNTKLTHVPEVKCTGELVITSPANKFVAYSDEVDVTGTVNPKGECKHIFLVISTMSGHNYFVTDLVTVSPDGTWEATAKLQIVPPGTKARIQAILCGEANAYPPEGCLSQVPNKGISSNSVVISRQVGLSKNKPEKDVEDSTPIPPPKTIYGSSTFPHNKKSEDKNKNIFKSDIDITPKYRINISEFSSSLVSGEVEGLDDPEKFKIVIYGKVTYSKESFEWLKLPYPGNQEAYGWAAIEEDGTWSISMRERLSQKKDPMSKYAVLLVDKDYEAPDRTDKISSLTFFVREMVD